MNSYVQDVMNRVVNDIMNGCPPWHRNWKLLRAYNSVTDKPYRGINTVLLWGHYECSEWAGYKQWKQIGAQVRKGEKGTPIIFYQPPFIDDDGQKKPPVYRVSKVWNAEQVDGYEPQVPRPVGEANEEFDRMVRASGAAWTHTGDQPCYKPVSDEIEMPDPKYFHSFDHYYHTFGHELTHWTGASTRLKRLERDGKWNIKGDPDYAREELVAEINAASMYAHFGFETPASEMRDSSYIASWMKAIPSNERCGALMYAARAAQEAFDYLVPQQEMEEAA